MRRYVPWSLALFVALIIPMVGSTEALAHDAVNFAFGTNLYRVVEGESESGVVIIQRCCHGTRPTTVRFSTAAGTAQVDGDYSSVDTTVELGTSSAQVPVEITIADDATEEGIETVGLSLDAPEGGTILGFPNDAVLEIIDGDGPSRLSFATTPAGNFELFRTVEVTAIRSGDTTSSATVSYSTSDVSAVAGSDYEPAAGSLVFDAGERIASVSLNLVNDTEVEGAETFRISLDSPSGALLIDPASIEVTIQDDDTAGSDTTPPLTAFHEPLHGETYRKRQFRTLFVFNQDDDGGSGVARVEVAIRKKLRDGSCAWWTRAGFVRKGCSSFVWNAKAPLDELVVFHLRTPFERSIGTRVRRYTAFSRGIDEVGNVQTLLDVGQNKNRFEIR